MCGKKVRRGISFEKELWISEGTKRDWSYFARWHYRSHQLGLTKRIYVLWHEMRAIGICVFTSPAMNLALRNRYFGLSGRVTSLSMKAINEQLICLSRIVIHPTYRGAGLTSRFIKTACELSGSQWVEALSQIGQVHPLFERAGFVRVGTCDGPKTRTHSGHSAIYGGSKRMVSRDTFEKSLRSQPVYYVWGRREEDLNRRDRGGTQR